MRKTRLAGGLAALAAVAALVGTLAGPVSAKGPRALTFDTMVALPPALTGTQSQAPLRGVSGGGLPWMLAEASGRLTTAGHLDIEVEGLVLAAGGSAGSNPIAAFRGLVSCLTSTGTVENVLTDSFPATTGPASAGGGNAEIEADLSLPSPCIAPIVFVTSPGGAWFATTGF